MRAVIICVSICFLFSCQHNQSRTCRVVVSFKGTNADSAFLRRIPLNGGFSKKIDSGLLQFTRDSLVFELPMSPDSLYELSLKFSRNRILLIPDCAYIRVIMDRKTDRNYATGSAATNSLLKFSETQDSLNQALKTAWTALNSGNINRIQKDSIHEVVQHLGKKIQDRYYDFGDTVSSSAAFMENYDYIDFQNDIERMKDYVTKAQLRFPRATAIGHLKEQVFKMAHIHEKELQVGEIFPRLSLPDLNNQLRTTDSANGAYTLIFFWASWCPNCATYDKVKTELAGDNRFNKLNFISVAIDDHTDLCRQIVEANKQPGLQLIDKDIWLGQTADKIAFDSIPFNFLIGPDQRILAKAIPHDSLVYTLRKFIR
jgi:thiol-disulfide isomerase/thioredoxin